MSVSRLLRAERMARKSARRKMPAGLSVMEQLLHIAQDGRWGDVVRDMEAAYPPLVMKPLPPPEPSPEVPPPVATKPEPPPAPAPPPLWHEELCHWRMRTAEDEYDDAERDELDDPLGIYS